MWWRVLACDDDVMEGTAVLACTMRRNPSPIQSCNRRRRGGEQPHLLALLARLTISLDVALVVRAERVREPRAQSFTGTPLRARTQPRTDAYGFMFSALSLDSSMNIMTLCDPGMPGPTDRRVLAAAG